MDRPGKPVQLGVIGAAHGIKGEVRVKSFTAEPLALTRYGPLRDGGGRAFEITASRAQGEMLIVRFRGIADRNAAEALAGTPLFVDRAALPDDTGEDEFYHADLVGLPIEDETGAALGSVRAIHDFGGGDILEAALPGGGSAMIPFTRAAVPVVDVKAGRLVVDRAAAGLIDDDDGPDRDAD